MKLSIVIVNYNTFDMTCNCISSIYKQKFPFACEVILVDNASIECDPQKFQEKFPELVLIKSPDNSGFARGNNQGMAVASGEYVLLLNSDTIVTEGALEFCVNYMDDPKQSKNTGMIGTMLRYGNGDMQLSSFNYRIGYKEFLLDNSLFYFLFKKLGFARHRVMQNALHDQQHPHDTEAVLGAFMFCRRSAIDQVGMMDPDFFMYYEELEWCYRFRDAGYRIQYLPQVYITHLEGGTNGAAFNLDKNAGINVKIKQQPVLSKMLLIYKTMGKTGVYINGLIAKLNIITNSLLLPFRSEAWKVSHGLYIQSYTLAKQYRNYMFKNFKPSFASSAFSFKIIK